MESLQRQASKFRDTVVKQQQAVFKTFVGSQAPRHSDKVIIDEAELQRHQQLEHLYGATKSAKHYQREIVKGIEGIILSGLRQLEIACKLADECRKYGTESPGTGGSLARASIHFGNAHSAIERERDNMHRMLGTQVADPLKSMVTGAPLEDARNLTQRYDKLRQEAESLVGEIHKRVQKSREGLTGPENAQKLQFLEQRMMELSGTMSVLGKEAASAMMAVEAQQQRQTLQRLISMVEAERAFHRRASDVLDQLYSQMISERHRGDAQTGESGSSNPFASMPPPPPFYEEVTEESTGLGDGFGGSAPPNSSYFLGEAIHSFDAETSAELSLAVGDIVVVRQVSPTGWSEGELRGKAGWFPSTFVEPRQRVPASKIIESGVNI